MTLNISDEKRKKLNTIFAAAFSDMLERAKEYGIGFTYDEDFMCINGYDIYSTPNGGGEIYFNDGNLNFQHFGTLGEGKSFVLQAVTNENPDPTPLDSDSFNVFSFDGEFDINDSLEDIIIKVLKEIGFKNIEMAINILKSDENLLGNSKLLIQKNHLTK